MRGTNCKRREASDSTQINPPTLHQRSASYIRFHHQKSVAARLRNSFTDETSCEPRRLFRLGLDALAVPNRCEENRRFLHERLRVCLTRPPRAFRWQSPMKSLVGRNAIGAEASLRAPTKDAFKMAWQAE